MLPMIGGSSIEYRRVDLCDTDVGRQIKSTNEVRREPIAADSDMLCDSATFLFFQIADCRQKMQTSRRSARKRKANDQK
jgi:hypothetical protein